MNLKINTYVFVFLLIMRLNNVEFYIEVFKRLVNYNSYYVCVHSSLAWLSAAKQIAHTSQPDFFLMVISFGPIISSYAKLPLRQTPQLFFKIFCFKNCKIFLTHNYPTLHSPKPSHNAIFLFFANARNEIHEFLIKSINWYMRKKLFFLSISFAESLRLVLVFDKIYRNEKNKRLFVRIYFSGTHVLVNSFLSD